MKIEVRKPTEEELKIAQNWPTWSKEASQFPWSYSEKETCLIIRGKAAVDCGNGEKVEFGAGDYVIFPSGLKCVWKITESIEKKYNFG
jgi:uncharacterized cupin superfamily protein